MAATASLCWKLREFLAEVVLAGLLLNQRMCQPFADEDLASTNACRAQRPPHGRRIRGGSRSRGDLHFLFLPPLSLLRFLFSTGLLPRRPQGPTQFSISPCLLSLFPDSPSRSQWMRESPPANRAETSSASWFTDGWSRRERLPELRRRRATRSARVDLREPGWRCPSGGDGGGSLRSLCFALRLHSVSAAADAIHRPTFPLWQKTFDEQRTCLCCSVEGVCWLSLGSCASPRGAPDGGRTLFGAPSLRFLFEFKGRQTPTRRVCKNKADQSPTRAGRGNEIPLPPRDRHAGGQRNSLERSSSGEAPAERPHTL